jgi:hypothetical protein
MNSPVKRGMRNLRNYKTYIECFEAGQVVWTARLASVDGSVERNAGDLVGEGLRRAIAEVKARPFP